MYHVIKKTSGIASIKTYNALRLGVLEFLPHEILNLYSFKYGINSSMPALDRCNHFRL